MIRPEHVPRPPVRWWRAVCLLGLLAGLLGMHGLAPGGAMAGHPHERPTAAAAAAPAASAASVAVHGGCSGEGDGHCGGGHVIHADATCASGAVSGGPSLPALVPDPVAVPVRADAPCPYAAAGPQGARAPPSLAELQLLRI
ncbi:DUF6153 family protein [Streptomyces sp. NPDC001315]|uniref:DUF6153 family protein n=1 Tax=Streptomyces sp. NPDC001315 TaxID=3364562 RepID=UPI00369E633D